jgi:hypothetical protein
MLSNTLTNWKKYGCMVPLLNRFSTGLLSDLEGASWGLLESELFRLISSGLYYI